MVVKFNVPTLIGRELEYIGDALQRQKISGNGDFTTQCQDILSQLTNCSRALMTMSCSSALELAAILLDLGEGDEVIMPSFTFPSTANAVALRGATPVFVDIRPDTFNIDERQIESAITPQTRAIFVVHYAGVACEMDSIDSTARRHGLRIVEDAAHAFRACYKKRPLGGLGDFGAFSFHESKNIVSGKGGALLIRDAALVHRAEIHWECGTNRLDFMKGAADFFNWVDLGGSFPPSEITAAFLFAQLECSEGATRRRLGLWQKYADALAPLAQAEKLRLPEPPEHCAHNGHIFHLLAPTADLRPHWLSRLEQAGIQAVSHYVPLHSAPAGRRFGRSSGHLSVTDDIARRIIRLPLHLGLSESDQSMVIDAVTDIATHATA